MSGSGSRRDPPPRRSDRRRYGGEPPPHRRPERLPGSRRGHGHEPDADRSRGPGGARASSRTPTASGLAHEIARAALMGARGNSGVILSQIVRGFAEVVGDAPVIDSPTLARAFRSASDAAYRAVRKPVEGTMLTVIRELAEEAEAQARPDLPVADLLRALVRRGEDALARTPRVPRDPPPGGRRRRRRRGAARARPRPDRGRDRRGAARAAGRSRGRRARRDPPGALAVPLLHRVRRRGRGARPRRARARARAARRLADGRRRRVRAEGARAHRRPRRGALARRRPRACSRGSRSRTCTARPSSARPACSSSCPIRARPRSSRSSPAKATRGSSAASGSTQRRRGRPVDEPVDRRHPRRRSRRPPAPEVVVLPNNSNVILSAEQAAEHAAEAGAGRARRARSRPGSRRWSPTTPPRRRRTTPPRWRRRSPAVATGAVTTASRDVQLNGLAVDEGAFLGLLEGEPVAGGQAFDEVAAAVVERLLAEPRGVLTILTGEGAPELNGLLDRLAAVAPGARGRRPGRRPAALPPAALGGIASTCMADPGRARRGQRRLPERAGGAARRSAATSRSSPRSRTANAVVERCRELEPDVLLVDYRLPGLDGVQVTRLVREHAPGVAVVALTAAAGEREVEALLDAGAVACIGKDRPLDEIVEAVAGGAARGGRLMELTPRTRRSSSTRPPTTRRARALPELAGRSAVRPLRRRELQGLRRALARTSSTSGCGRLRAADDLAADARRLPRRPTEGSAQYERILSLHIPAEALGDGRERAAGGRGARRRQGARDRQRHGVGRPGAARARRAAPPRAGTTDEEIDALVERSGRENRDRLHRRHARVPRQGRPDREGGGDGGDAPEHQADPRRSRAARSSR